MWPSAWRISYWDKVTLVVAACPFHMEINLAEPPERRAHALPRDDLRQTHEGSGSDHVAGQQLHPTLLQIPRQPMHGGDRRRKRVLAPTGRYNGAVQFEPTLHARERQALPALDTRTSDARGIKAEVGRRRPFVQGAVRHPPPKQLQAHMAANDGVVDPRLKRTAAAAACFEPATARFGTPGANASVGRMRCGSPRGLSAPVGSAGGAPDRRDPIPEWETGT